MGESDLKNARRYFEQSLQMNRQLYGDAPHADIGATLHELGVLCRDESDLKNARWYLEQSLQMERQVYGDDSHREIQATLGLLKLLDNDDSSARRTFSIFSTRLEGTCLIC